MKRSDREVVSRHLDADEVASLAAGWYSGTFPVTVDSLPQDVAKFGWRPGPAAGDEDALFETGYDLNDPEAFVETRNGLLLSATVKVTDFIRRADETQRAGFRQAFIDDVLAVADRIGPPRLVTPGGSHLVAQWRTRGGDEVQLTLTDRNVVFTANSSDAMMDIDAGASLEDTAPGSDVAAAPAPTSWYELAERMALTIAGFEAGMYLIIGDPRDAARYAQFMMDDDATQLTAQISAQALGTMPESTAEASDEVLATIETSGFVLEPDGGNYNRDLQLPLDADTIRRLARAATIALRDLFGVPAPGALEYSCWRHDVERSNPEFAERLAWVIPGANPRRLPWLGLALRDAR